MCKTLDVIIPVRARRGYDVVERLKWRAGYDIPEGVKFIVIDYGSHKDSAQRIQECCISNGFEYHYVETTGIWNASVARNIAINKSSADYLLFEDLDLFSRKTFYRELLLEVHVNLESGLWDFLCIPVAYLTQLASEPVQGVLDNNTYSYLLSSVQTANNDIVENFAQASSYLVCSRDLAISVGGYDEEFIGWGFEDSDFWFRLLLRSDLSRPRDFFKLDTRNYSEQVNWRGWRALFRLYADVVAGKGLYAFHAWHPVTNDRNDAIRARNHKVFLENVTFYLSRDYVSLPLKNPRKKHTLFFDRNPHSFNNALFRRFPNPIVIPMEKVRIDRLAEIVEENQVAELVFNNPYGNETRLALFQKAKELGIACYVVERGALPNSIYIDNNFCAASTSYKQHNWDSIDFDDCKKEEARTYINEVLTSGLTLEPQGHSIGGRSLKRKLFGEKSIVKVLFIALQSPSDTTTNFFCGPVESYENFLQQIRSTCNNIPDGWVVVYKNHPLTLDKVEFENSICVDQFHINDILEMADAVTLINSGVGVLSLMHMKPVFYFGQCFYANQSLNWQVVTSNDLCAYLVDLPSVCADNVYKFVWYLRYKFYSYATWDRQERSHTQKAKLSISKNIQYYEVRESDFVWIAPHKITFDLKKSPLFDRYRLDNYIHNKAERSNEGNLKKTELVVSRSSSVVPQKVIEVSNNSPRVLKKMVFKRKLNKFFRSPGLFFFDMLKKRYD